MFNARSRTKSCAETSENNEEQVIPEKFRLKASKMLGKTNPDIYALTFLEKTRR